MSFEIGDVVIVADPTSPDYKFIGYVSKVINSRRGGWIVARDISNENNSIIKREWVFGLVPYSFTYEDVEYHIKQAYHVGSRLFVGYDDPTNSDVGVITRYDNGCLRNRGGYYSNFSFKWPDTTTEPSTIEEPDDTFAERIVEGEVINVDNGVASFTQHFPSVETTDRLVMEHARLYGISSSNLNDILGEEPPAIAVANTEAISSPPTPFAGWRTFNSDDFILDVV